MSSVPLGDLGFFREFPNGLGFGFGPDFPPIVLAGEGSDLSTTPSRLAGHKDGDGVGVPDPKTAIAMKNHSEAERRRRERINSHLAVLRRMVPGADKLDKAALLAAVIDHVKKLKENAAESSRGHTIPSDADEVRVEVEVEGSATSSCSSTANTVTVVKASLCCEDRPETLVDLKQALQTLHLKTISAEISTLNGRVKNVLVMAADQGYSGTVDRHLFVASVHQALKSILDKVNSQVDLLPRALLESNKRRRISPF